MLNMTWEFKLEPTAAQVLEIERTLICVSQSLELMPCANGKIG